MAVTNRGSILISTANDIGSSLVDVIGGEGYSPNEWAKKINICGIAAADIPTALDNIEESTPSGTDRGDISLDTGNAVGAVLNKKFNTARGFKPSEWASAISKLTELEVKTASGAIASFNDGADDVPIESATFEFSPNQDLNGQDAPYPPGGGKNLFNAEDIYAHGLWNVYGSWTNHESYNAYIIKVDPETDYTYNAGFTGITTFLDSNGDYISGSNQGSGLSSRTVTTPANCAYITASILITNLNGTQQIEKGSSSTAYAPYANICPITGYEGLTIYQTGKNLLDFNSNIRDTSSGGLDFEVKSDGGIRCYGKTTRTYAYITNTINVWIPAGTSLIFSRTDNPSFRLLLNCTFADGSGSVSVIISADNYTKTWVVSKNVSQIRLEVASLTNDTDYDFTVYPMLEVGNTRTTWEPYKGKTPIVDSFGRTVYGGSRATDGTLTETYGIVTFDGSEAWKKHNSIPSWFYLDAVLPLAYGDNNKDDFQLCNMGTQIKYANIASATNGQFGYSSAIRRFVFVNTAYTEVTDFQTWLSNNNLVVCYKLATPTTDTLSAVNISTFYGGNNVYSDTNGDTTVAYRADIDLSAT